MICAPSVSRVTTITANSASHQCGTYMLAEGMERVWAAADEHADQRDQRQQQDNDPDALLDLLGDREDETFDNPDRQIDHAREHDQADQEPKNTDCHCRHRRLLYFASISLRTSAHVSFTVMNLPSTMLT